MSTARTESKLQIEEKHIQAEDTDFVAYKQIWAQPLDERFINEYYDSPTAMSHALLSLRFNHLARGEKNFLESLVKKILQKKEESKEEILQSSDWMILGKAYELGLGVNVDYKAALMNYQNAHSPLGIFESGRMYFNLGNTRKTDEPKIIQAHFLNAKTCFELAETNGIPEATYMLGRMHYNGNFFKPSKPEALKHYRIAAKLGCAEAWYALIQPDNTHLVPAQKNLDFIQKAIQAGLPVALAHYGRAIIDDIEAQASFKTPRQLTNKTAVHARLYFEELIKREHKIEVTAEHRHRTEDIAYLLANAYETGRGVEQKPIEAVKLYRQHIEASGEDKNHYKKRALDLIRALQALDWPNKSPELVYHACIALDKIIIDTYPSHELLAAWAHWNKNPNEQKIFLNALHQQFNDIAIKQPELFVKFMSSAEDTIERIGSILKPEATAKLLSQTAGQIDEYFFKFKGEKSLPMISAGYLFFNPTKTAVVEESKPEMKSEPKNKL